MLNLITQANFFVVIIALIIIFFLLGFILATLLDRPQKAPKERKTRTPKNPAVTNKQSDTLGQDTPIIKNMPDLTEPQGHIGDQRKRYYNNYW